MMHTIHTVNLRLSSTDEKPRVLLKKPSEIEKSVFSGAKSYVTNDTYEIDKHVIEFDKSVFTGIPEFLESGCKSWTLDSELRTLDTGLWTLDSGHWTLDAGLWMLDPERWALDAELWTLDTGL